MQQSPSSILYYQIIAKIDQFKNDYAANKMRDVNEMSAAITAILSDFEQFAGKSSFKYSPIIKGEAPSSAKTNRMIADVQQDINILQNQMDTLRAFVIFLYNVTTTELQKAGNQNSQLQNRLKTLQLYSSSHSSDVIVFSDFFADMNLVDIDRIPIEERPYFLPGGSVSLGVLASENLSTMKNSSVKVLETSNGFMGNNQEIEDPNTASINSVSSEKDYQFVGVKYRAASFQAILDNTSNTWVEYEYNWVNPTDRVVASNLNFSYRRAIKRADQSDFVDWATGPAQGVLRLDLEFDLKAVKSINEITYLPYGLKNNSNHPVKVSGVKVSQDGTTWIDVQPDSLWVGTKFNVTTARAAGDVVVGQAVWSFARTSVRYVRLTVEQKTPVVSDIGHTYFTKVVELPRPINSSGSTFYQSATPTDDNSFELANFDATDWTEKEVQKKKKDQTDELPVDTSSMTISLSATQTHHGTKALKLVNTKGGQQDYVFKRSTVLKPNTRYVYSAWVYIQEGNFDSALYNRGLFVKGMTPNPARVVKKTKHKYKNKTYGRTVINDKNTRGQWRLHEVVFTTVADKNHTVEFRLYSPKGTVYYDDVRIQEAVELSSRPVPTQVERAEGPIPLDSNPLDKIKPNATVSNGFTQHIEFFKGMRWAIGIRDISFSAKEYSSYSTVISEPFRIPGEVDRVVLESDITVPDSYPSDTLWVKYYIAYDDSTWLSISRIDDNFFGIPEVIAFNDPIPVELRDPGVQYYNTPNPVTSLRVKIEIFRPNDNLNSSPRVNYYSLKVKKK